LWIALPMLALLLFTNLALGIISRVAPQMNVYAVGFPITLSVGLVGMAATLPMLDRPFQSLLERAIEIFTVGR
jgi:flagellar biosynthetic protein FliR